VPPLSSYIVGINLVSAKFDTKSGLPILYRIEPTHGITDPKLHSSSWVLIQDDVKFNAAVTGLGAMGVIYSVTITTVPFYWVVEFRDMVDWRTARSMLEQGSQGEILKYHNAEIWVNPYTNKALISRRETVTAPPTAKSAGPTESIFVSLVKSLPALSTIANKIFGRDLPVKILGYVLAHFLKLFPLLIPSVSSAACHG
jgi:hypothetical protein